MLIVGILIGIILPSTIKTIRFHCRFKTSISFKGKMLDIIEFIKDIIFNIKEEFY